MPRFIDPAGHAPQPGARAAHTMENSSPWATRRLHRVLAVLQPAAAPPARDSPLRPNRHALRPWAKDSPTPGSGATRGELRQGRRMSRPSGPEDLTSTADMRSLTPEDVAHFKQHGWPPPHPKQSRWHPQHAAHHVRVALQAAHQEGTAGPDQARAGDVAGVGRAGGQDAGRARNLRPQLPTQPQPGDQPLRPKELGGGVC